MQISGKNMTFDGMLPLSFNEESEEVGQVREALIQAMLEPEIISNGDTDN